MLVGLECSLRSILLHKALQLNLNGLNIHVRAGCLLWDSGVAAWKFIDLSIEGLEHVLDVSDAVRDWIVWDR